MRAKNKLGNFLDSSAPQVFRDEDQGSGAFESDDEDENPIKAKVAIRLIQYVNENVPRCVQRAIRHPIVVLGDGFRKSVKPHQVGGENAFLKLHYSFCAAKLGLPLQILEQNRSFFDFAKKNALHRCKEQIFLTYLHRPFYI